MSHDSANLDSGINATETRSLRALARAIVCDERVATGLVPPAWIAAISTPPRQRWSLRRWLAGIARKREPQHWDEPERAGVSPGQPVGHDSIERVDLLRQLSEHVRSLSEPCRRTVLARYFDRLEPREIARREGVPCSAVRTRLRRGIELLRERMDASTAGGRRGWVLPLFSLAAVSEPGSNEGRESTGLGTEGGTRYLAIIGKPGVVACVLLAVVLPLAFVLWPRTVRDTRAMVREHEEQSAHRQSAASGHTKLHDDREPERRTQRAPGIVELSRGDQDESRFTVFGVVRDTNGRAVAHATVRNDLQVTETAADGSFSLQFERERTPAVIASARRWGKAVPAWRHWVRADAPGLASAVQELGNASNGARVRVDLVLGPALTVRGRVMDRAGRPIARAFVKTMRRGQRSVRTADDGTFEIADLDARVVEHVVCAFATGYVAGQQKVQARTGVAVAEADFVLSRGARVHGCVMGPDDKPVAGAFLTVGTDLEQVRTRSAADGSFALTGVGAGRKLLNVRHPRFAVFSREVEVPPSGQALLVEVELERGGRITGRAYGNHGSALIDAEVVATLGGGVVVRSTQTDAEGSFELNGLPKDRLVLRCRATGYLPLMRPIQPNGPSEIVLTLKRAGRVGATVTDAATGAAVQNFEVRVIEPSGTPRPSFVVGARVDRTREGWRTIASVGGQWLSRELPEGFEGDLEFRAVGYAPLLLRGVRATTDATPRDHRVWLTPGVRLFGTVLRPGGAPLANARIRVTPNREPVPFATARHDSRYVRSDSEGRFVLADLGAGPHRLSVEHPDWGVFVHELTIPRGVRRWKEFVQLRPQGTVLGVVRPSAGEPRGRAAIELHAMDVPGIGKETWKTRADSSGRFEFAHVPFGYYRVSLVERIRGHTLETFAMFVTLRAGRAVAKLELGPVGTATIVGTLKLSTTDVVIGSKPTVLPRTVVVRLSPRVAKQGEFQSVAPRVTLAEDGKFEFRRVEPGRYRVYAQLYRGTRISHDGSVVVKVGDHASATADIELRRHRR